MPGLGVGSGAGGWVPGPGGSGPGGWWSGPGGVSVPGGYIPACTEADPPCGQTDACKNITLAQLRCGR